MCTLGDVTLTVSLVMAPGVIRFVTVCLPIIIIYFLEQSKIVISNVFFFQNKSECPMNIYLQRVGSCQSCVGDLKKTGLSFVISMQCEGVLC